MSRTIGILGGSGLYALDGPSFVRELTVTTPFGAPSDVIVEAELSGTRVLFLARHGRGHRLAAHEVNYRANVFALKQLGATHLLSASAVGSLQQHIRPGDVVVVNQYIDQTRRRAASFFEGRGVVVHVSLADPVDADLHAGVCQAAERAGARVHGAGTYVCIEGPQFSTRAESRLFKGFGADVIGMTNMPEARLAREAELAYASLCLVTDYDAWHHSEAPVQVSAVLEQVRANAELASRTLIELLERAGSLASDGPASKTLDMALLTAPAQIAPEVRRELAPLLERVLAARGDAPTRDA